MSLTFQLHSQDGQARLGTVTTTHGQFPTPMFMPVGTQATVKGMTPQMVADAGSQIILGNTYHLALRPGSELIAKMGGLHQFMGWSGSILTDSGGYQIFSLATQRKITDAGATFRSHINGDLLELSPEKAVQIQEELGSDIAMVLDECPSSVTDYETIQRATERSILWAKRCQDAHKRSDQAQFAIVQGGLHLDLRTNCAERLIPMGFPGYALGGFSVGESLQEMLPVLATSAQVLPVHKPRYLMGVGKPEDIIEAISCGIDMFDCVLPTRNGRNAQALTWNGPVRLRHAKHRENEAPIDGDCLCYCCRHFTCAYLNHLFHADEMLGPTLVSIHNVFFYLDLVAKARDAIRSKTFASFRSQSLARLGVET